MTRVLIPRVGRVFVEPLVGSLGVEAESGTGFEGDVCSREEKFGSWVCSGLRMDLENNQLG